MPAAIEIELGQFSSLMDRINGHLTNGDFRKPLLGTKVLLQSETKQNFEQAKAPDGAAWKPITFGRVRGGDKPLRDRGLLMASVGATGQNPAVFSLTQDELTFGTNLEYAAVHQFGKTITPKGARALAIPATREALRAGSPRNFPGELFVVWRRGERSGALMEKRGNELVKHYTLASKAVIPARPYLGFNDRIYERMDLIFLDHLEQRYSEAG